VTDLLNPTKLPFITFTFHFKIDKKGNIIVGEYKDFDIVFVERY